ncbi:MAG: hypothetical protein WCB19_07415 [Thermoplasmata archaeon]
MSEGKYRIFRLTIDLACTTDNEAEGEAERMCDSGPYSETVYGAKVASIEELPVDESAFKGDEFFAEANAPKPKEPDR